MPGNRGENIQRWATEGGGEGDPAASSEDIRAYVASEIAEFSNLVEDTTSIPGTATSRAAGYFSDADDLFRYLEQGGLIIPDGGGFIPNPIVYVHHFVLEGDEDIYEVWIDEDT